VQGNEELYGPLLKNEACGKRVTQNTSDASQIELQNPRARKKAEGRVPPLWGHPFFRGKHLDVAHVKEDSSDVLWRSGPGKSEKHETLWKLFCTTCLSTGSIQ